MKKTYSAKPSEVERKWYVVDASETTLGRLSTEIANILTGKNKPMFTKHIDCGDFVIVLNSDKLVVTGQKMDDKMYYRHSGYPGGLKEATLKEVISKDSTKAIQKSVKGMLPVNKLRAERLKRLKVYKNGEHMHQAQTPIVLNLKKGAK
ncbi:50S ribosomal protein L13 [Candidatus Saccharibacteria bacterium RIFCSPHIGHO2_12_FULL_41_12]|nr:MAG: 50S ribosomal protein L13 [Candidatus Saccharibacteria bacterium RIFCSPHIGHO2_12_FULL_41_12]